MRRTSFFPLLFVLTSTACVSSQVLGTTDLGKIDMLKISDLKRGEACRDVLLGIFPSGSDDIRKAAANGSISTVQLVERTSKNLLFLKQTHCTVVFGQ